MDSYGIHQTELTNNNAAHHVADINSAINQHNAQVLDGFKQRMSKTRGSDRLANDENVGIVTKDILGAGLALKTATDMRARYGGLSGALSRGTSDNVFNVSGGRFGSKFIPMGPQETLTRNAGAIGGVAPSTRRNVLRAQRADVQAGSITTSELSDAGKTTSELISGAKPAVEDAGLDIVGKTFKKGLTTIGTDVGTAARLGSVAGAGLSAAGAIYTGIEDFGDGGKKFASEGTLTKAGDITSIVSGGLDVLSAVAPIFAPVAALAGVAGAIMDAVGESRDEGAGLNREAPKAQANIVAQSDAGQVASVGQKTSIQTLSNKSSSY